MDQQGTTVQGFLKSQHCLNSSVGRVVARQPGDLSNPAGGNLCDITEVFDANIANNFVWCVEKIRIKFLQNIGAFNSKSSESSCVPCGIQTINLEKL